MLTIDVYVSAAPDTQLERAMTERVLRSIAADCGVPLIASYSCRLRRLEPTERIRENEKAARSVPLIVHACFWEKTAADGLSPAFLPNPGQYDLTVLLVAECFGAPPDRRYLLPDGSRPESSVEYEIAWALDTSRLLLGGSELKVFRRRPSNKHAADPSAERFFSRWQGIFGAPFTEACLAFSSAGEFEILIRQALLAFFQRQLAEKRLFRQTRNRVANARRLPGLRPFDYEDAAAFAGRVDSLDAALRLLREGYSKGSPSLVVSGPTGSGKSSFVCAGVLPLLTQTDMIPGCGPWRHATLRPGCLPPGEGPLAALAAAILKDTALGRSESQIFKNWRELRTALAENPKEVAGELVRILDHLAPDDLDRQLDAQESQMAEAGLREATELKLQPRLSDASLKACLALVFDQLEELYAKAISPSDRAGFFAALLALVGTKRIFLLTTIRLDSDGKMPPFPGLTELLTHSEVLKIGYPSSEELIAMVHCCLNSQGVRLDRRVDFDSQFGEPLRLTEGRLSRVAHFVSRLCRRSQARRPLDQSDIEDLGGLADCLELEIQDLYLGFELGEQERLDAICLTLYRAVRMRSGCLISLPISRAHIESNVDYGEEPSARRILRRLVREGYVRCDYDADHQPLFSFANAHFGDWWRSLRQTAQEDQLSALTDRNSLPLPQSDPQAATAALKRAPGRKQRARKLVRLGAVSLVVIALALLTALGVLRMERAVRKSAPVVMKKEGASPRPSSPAIATLPPVDKNRPSSSPAPQAEAENRVDQSATPAAVITPAQTSPR